MFEVKDFMTREVVTTDRNAKISEVLDLMRFHHIHRIPVINAKDELVGLITEGMIAGHENSATSLSIYELNYLLSKTEVKTVMIRKVVSIQEDALMEEAAAKMLKHDVGCLPVVNAENKVCGILTQNDVFKAFLDVLGWEKESLRLTLKVKDEIGTLEKIGAVFAGFGISIYNIGVYESSDGIASMVIRTENTSQNEELFKALEKAGFSVEQTQSGN